MSLQRRGGKDLCSSAMLLPRFTAVAPHAPHGIRRPAKLTMAAGNCSASQATPTSHVLLQAQSSACKMCKLQLPCSAQSAAAVK
jgi:hypothetical protein